MSMIQSDLLLGQEGGAGYTISRSLRFSSIDSAFLSRTPASAGNRKTWTWAGWVKRSAINPSNGFNETHLFSCVFEPRDSDANYFRLMYNGDRLQASWYTAAVNTAAVFRDQSAWYHVVCAVDLTQATASNRVKLYVNGIEQVKNTDSPPAQNLDQAVNATQAHYIARGPFNVSQIYNHDGYLADVHFIDGQALTPSSFGEFDANGEWQPKAYTGTYGTNGFRLPFSNNASTTTISQDSSGNNNHWTANNISVTAGAGNDSLVDTPTNGSQIDTGVGGEVTGNYATLNPLRGGAFGGGLSNGNLDVSAPSSGNDYRPLSTIGVSSGKWYWEVTKTSSASTSTDFIVGIANATSVGGTYAPGSLRDDPAGTIYGVSINFDTLTFAVKKNNVALYSTSIAQDTYFAYVNVFNAGVAVSATVNFGQRPFAYTAPSGFKALCDTNLPAPVVAKSSDYFQTVLYTGNGSTQTISGLGFSPDFAWFKVRNNTSHHTLYDIVRGATKSLCSSNTNAEATEGGGLSAFTSDGFSLSGDNTIQGSTNANGGTYVAWCFDAGANTVTNTQGSITSQVRANASAGFSIVTASVPDSASGPTIGHGLGVTPALVIGKNRSSGLIPWYVWSSSLAANNKLILNSTAAAVTDTNTWGTMTSSTLQMGATGTAVNVAWIVSGTQDVVFYCFAPVAGYSSFGSYTGNGSASDGPFVYTGFRPKFVLIKGSSFVSNWNLLDGVRDSYNVADKILRPNLSNAELNSISAGSGFAADFLSNGFKLRASLGDSNSNAETFVWAAFAESPFAYSRAR